MVRAHEVCDLSASWIFRKKINEDHRPKEIGKVKVQLLSRVRLFATHGL